MNTMPLFPEGTPGFVEELRREPLRRIRWDRTALPVPETLDLRGGLTLSSFFPDPEKLLESAAADVDSFFKRNRISGPEVKVLLKKASALSGEDFAFSVSKDGILLEAGSIEGARRSLYRLIARLRELNTPDLPFAARKITRYWLKDRISRCFFSPIKRPPFFRDELLDDLDYYPESYLSRLAESGINGLWITVVLDEFKDDPDGRKRGEKLKKNILRCRRYGIKIWAFCIEPRGWSDINPAPHAELIGPSVYGRWNGVCVDNPYAEELLYNAVNRLFTLVPGLGGMITISHGERVTSCLSCRSLYGDGTLPCSGKCGLSPKEIINKVLSPMVRGMRDASPEARLVSWLYMPHADQPSEWIYQLSEGMPPEVVMMTNFESGVKSRQLGKIRAGGDYWLSAAGPGDKFCRLAERRHPFPVGAKLQVGCSHECATVPFIPVPGQLYRKYKAMHSLGVELVMQCWFFGNYPGVMNDAAGFLATEEALELNEKDFLTALARPDWGRKAAEVADIWHTFAAAYENYPLNILFQYYGPMHDGPVWPLYPAPVKRRLPASWRPYAEPAGDDIGECLAGHTLDEAAALTGRLVRLWKQGAAAFEKTAQEFADDRERQQDLTLVQALAVQFDSGHNILTFYALRKRFLETGDPFYSTRMREIMEKEIRNSYALEKLCLADPRLGYHSEAEVFKYFPEKLRWRARLLEEQLAVSFSVPETEQVCTPGTVYCAPSFSWQWELDGETLRFTVEILSEAFPDEVLRFFITDKDFSLFPWFDLVVRRDNRTPDDNIEHQTLARPPEGAVRDWRQAAVAHCCDTGSKWQVKLEIPWGTVDHTRLFRIGIQHDKVKQWGAVAPDDIFGNYPPGDYHQEDRLYQGFYSPEKTVLLKL